MYAPRPPATPILPIPQAPLRLMAGLGQALRWLREKQARKQYRVADNAGITKGMLSAYETGRQRPSLETLEKILETLGCDLNDLHNALQIVHGQPERVRSWRGWQTPAQGGVAGPAVEAQDPAPKSAKGKPSEVREAITAYAPSGPLDTLLGSNRQRLATEEEQALTQMVDGFHSLVRVWHHSLLSLERRGTPKE